jgi:SAM-dependent methyltransferase
MSTSDDARMRADYVQYGCGLCAPVEWTNFDVSPSLRLRRVPLLGRFRLGPPFPKNVRYGDVTKGLPVAPGSCTAVYCSHTLEHLSFNDFRRAMANTYSYLKPGGTFRLVLPDLEALVKAYAEATDSEAAVRFMQGTMGVEERQRGIKGILLTAIGNSYHLWMWDYKAIADYLRRAGFVDIRRASFGDSPDPMFKLGEHPGRWEGHLGVECRRTA